MGACTSALYNDHPEQVTVEVYNGADTVFACKRMERTIQPNKWGRVEAADGVWLKVKISVGQVEGFSLPCTLAKDSTIFVGEIVPVHKLKIENRGDKDFKFGITNRHQNNEGCSLAPGEIKEFKPVRVPVVVTAVDPNSGAAVAAKDAYSNSGVVFDGTTSVKMVHHL